VTCQVVSSGLRQVYTTWILWNLYTGKVPQEVLLVSVPSDLPKDTHWSSDD